MKTLWFEGYSDDTFMCLGEGIDLDPGTNDKPIYFLVKSGNEGLIVWGQYASGPGDGWNIGVCAMKVEADEIPIPEWNISFQRSKRAYSPRLIIVVPDDVEVVVVDYRGNIKPRNEKEKIDLIEQIRAQNKVYRDLLEDTNRNILRISETIKRMPQT